MSRNMGPQQLRAAAENGDVNILLRAISLYRSNNYSNISVLDVDHDRTRMNLFHIAASFGQVEFIKEAIKELPNDILNKLLFQLEYEDWTPLSIALSQRESSHAMVKLILDHYHSMPTDEKPPKPWLELMANDETMLHYSLHQDKRGNDDDCAVELLLCDVESQSYEVDSDGNSPLFKAVKFGYTKVAEKILTLSSSPSFASSDGSTPLHFAPNCSETVLKLLLRKNFSESIDKTDNRGYSVLHQWAEIGKAWPCRLILESDEFAEARTKIFKELVFLKENKAGDTPLHISARKKESELCEILIQCYHESEDGIQPLVSVESPPWRVKNEDGSIPLTIAMYQDERHDELAMKILSIDPTICQILNNQGESPFFIAVRVVFEQVVEEIWKIEQPRYNMLRRNDGTTVLHYLHLWPEITGRRLLEKYWWMNNLANDKKITPLDTAKENNALWLVNLLMNPSLIRKEPFDWITACEREETSAIFAFIDNCYDLQRLCNEQNDTPLHHIKFPTYIDYQNFLKLPLIIELKNTTDHDGSTPLHCALERKDMLLSKILLRDNGVDRTILNNKGITAMNLLGHLYKENDDWKKMCNEINVNPFIKTTYIQHGANLEQIRNTLSVVAALLATITFAAAFTLPGGINSSTGEALLAKTDVFLVFLLADVVAMCLSMLVLFFLIWSMISKPDTARLLVDRSVYILLLSLLSTLLAFMTGIYTVIRHSSLWAAILIIVVCSLITIFILAFMTINKTTWRKVTAKLTPAARTPTNDRWGLLEEGGVAQSSAGTDASNKTD